MVFSRNSLIDCGNSHRHCVSRCAYGTTYNVGVWVISGAFIVCAATGNEQAAIAATRLLHRSRQQHILVAASKRENRVIGARPTAPVSHGGLRFQLLAIRINPTRPAHAWGLLYPCQPRTSTSVPPASYEGCWWLSSSPGQMNPTSGSSLRHSSPSWGD